MKYLKIFNEPFEINHTPSGEIPGELVNITSATNTIEHNDSNKDQRTTIKEVKEKGE
ncbi:MAG: hypothetical protein ACJARP_002303 [Vicingaceae bacterium]|jgi:hypothetical protein